MSSSTINSYGDQLVDTTGRHGADIASQRLDDLDRRAIVDALARSDSREAWRRALSAEVGVIAGIASVILAALALPTCSHSDDAKARPAERRAHETPGTSSTPAR